MSIVLTHIQNSFFDSTFPSIFKINNLPASIICCEAKVLYSYLLSLPDGTNYSRESAAMVLGSKYKLDKAVSDLKSAGLLEIKQLRSNGLYSGCIWEVKSRG